MEMLKNPRIVFIDTSFGYTGESAIFANRELTEKDFKKWYNNVCRRNRFNHKVDVFAEYGVEDDYHEISQYWAHEEMLNNPVFPFA